MGHKACGCCSYVCDVRFVASLEWYVSRDGPMVERQLSFHPAIALVGINFRGQPPRLNSLFIFERTFGAPFTYHYQTAVLLRKISVNID